MHTLSYAHIQKHITVGALKVAHADSPFLDKHYRWDEVYRLHYSLAAQFGLSHTPLSSARILYILTTPIIIIIILCKEINLREVVYHNHN